MEGSQRKIYERPPRLALNDGGVTFSGVYSVTTRIWVQILILNEFNQ